jgi:hypothetical protein
MNLMHRYFSETIMIANDIEVKVNLSQCLIKHRVVKTYEGVEIYFRYSLLGHEM